MTARVWRIKKTLPHNSQRGLSKRQQGWRNLLYAQSLLPVSRVRVWPFVVLVVGGMLFLVGRLTQLTVVEGSYQRLQADENRVATVRITAPRGVFIDRLGTPLVHNVPVYKHQIPGSTLAQVAFEEINREEALRLAYQGDERVFFDLKRDYLCGRACAALLGYMGEISEEELQVYEENYVMGDNLGKSGLEKVYEEQLRGVSGNELVETNAQGKAVRVIGKTEAVNGHDMHLAIDSRLQQVAYEAFGDKFKGAVVAQVPDTGELLALVSVPSFNPNNILASLEEPNKPFFNRALAGAYPPGSIFKLVPAIGGLEDGVVTKETVYEDTGEIRVGQYRYGNWYYDEYGGTEGAVSVVKALQRSNDIYFYRLGENLGPQKLAEWARLFGYGTTTGLEGLNEVVGTVPDPAWKLKQKGEKWFLGNTYHMAIGQGDVMVTVVQANRVTAAVAAGGVLCPVRMTTEGDATEACAQLGIRETTIETVVEGMKAACAPGGTGVPFFRSTVPVACKTGTAQQGGEHHEPHAWFTVFAPADNPQIALTVLVEEGGQGSEVAAPLAKTILDWWFLNRYQSANEQQ